MLIIGISGQTGAGKSTVANILSKEGFGENLEVDSLGHELLKDSATIKQLTATFGEDIITDNQIDRKKLGAKAFANKEATEKLNSIMHPNMVKMIEKIIKEKQENGEKSLIINAALLYKMQLNKLCNRIIYVQADSEIRVKRLVNNRGYTEERARERLFSQDPTPSDNKVIIIENNGSEKKLLEQIQNLKITE